MTSDVIQTSTPTLVSFRLPEPPERNLDEVTSYDHVYEEGGPLHLKRHFGRPESTLVKADKWIVARRGESLWRVPDLMIAFDVDPELYDEQNGYVIADQGKPPDFILEVASPSTATIDTVDKRVDYAAFGVREYWRFDHTGESHGTRLAGDRLVEGRYEPIEIVEVSADVLEGLSEALGLVLRWDHGQLGWIDPATGEHIPTFDSERAGRVAEAEARQAAESGRRTEEAARRAAEAGRRTEEVARRAAEARVRELEAELRRLEGR